jgi:acyl-CoA thioester hydrolase
MNNNQSASILNFAWDFPKPFLLEVTAQPQQIDGLNHVNNAVYVDWCEQAAWQHSEFLGLSIDDYQHLDRAMAITRAEYNYIQSAYLDDQLTLATWLTNHKKISMRRQFQLIRNKDQVTLLRAEWDIVCIEISTGKPKKMPEVFNRLYGDAVVNKISP